MLGMNGYLKHFRGNTKQNKDNQTWVGLLKYLVSRHSSIDAISQNQFIETYSQDLARVGFKMQLSYWLILRDRTQVASSGNFKQSCLKQNKLSTHKESIANKIL